MTPQERKKAINHILKTMRSPEFAKAMEEFSKKIELEREEREDLERRQNMRMWQRMKEPYTI